MIETAADIDRIDLKIMNVLQQDGRISNLKLAESVSLSATAVLARVQRLTRGGYIVGYAAHCWELFAIRSWLVAFLSFAAGGAGLSAPTIAALINLLGPPASISGNEIASGRRLRVVRVTMTIGAALACLTGAVAGQGAVVVILVTSLYVLAVMADSGPVQASPAT